MLFACNQVDATALSPSVVENVNPLNVLNPKFIDAVYVSMFPLEPLFIDKPQNSVQF